MLIPGVKHPDGRVVHVGRSADVENDVFVCCAFDGFLDADWGGWDGGDFLEADGSDPARRFLDVVAERGQSLSGCSRQQRLFFLNSSFSAGGKHVLSVRYRIEDEELPSVNHVIDQMTLDHVWSRLACGVFWVCEGPLTALEMISSFMVNQQAA